MSLRHIAALCGFAVAAALAPAHAAEVKVLASNAVKSIFEDLGPRYEKASGNKVTLVFGTSGELQALLDKGEAFDLAVLSVAGMEDQWKKGVIANGSPAPLARSGAGVAVKRGAPLPDISTTEAFKRVLLGAKSVGMVDGTPTGNYFKTLFPKLGIAEQMQARIKYVDSKTGAGGAAASGEVEIGLTQMAEILAVPGAELVGPLPEEIQVYTDFATGVSARAKQPAAAAAFVKYIATPEAGQVIREKGMAPH